MKLVGIHGAETTLSEENLRKPEENNERKRLSGERVMQLDGVFCLPF